MFVPVIYAILTWYAAMRWRRRWPAFACVGVSTFLLVLTINLLRAFGEGVRREYGHALVLLVPYTVVVAGIGLYIACLPRRLTSTQCRGCGYDLAGLDPVGLNCPECSAPWRGRGSGFEERVELTPRLTGEPRKRTVL